MAFKKKTMIHIKLDKIQDDLEKGEDAPEYPEFAKIKIIKTKADKQEIPGATRIQQDGE